MAQDEQFLRELEVYPLSSEELSYFDNNAETSASGLLAQCTPNMEPDGRDGGLVAGHKRPREDPTVDGPAHFRDNQPSPSPDVSSCLNGAETSASEQYSGGPSMDPTDGPAAGRMERTGGKKPKIVHSFAAEEEAEKSMQPKWRACKQLFEASLLPRHMEPRNCHLRTQEQWERLLGKKKNPKLPCARHNDYHFLKKLHVVTDNRGNDMLVNTESNKLFVHTGKVFESLFRRYKDDHKTDDLWEIVQEEYQNITQEIVYDFFRARNLSHELFGLVPPAGGKHFFDKSITKLRNLDLKGIGLDTHSAKRLAEHLKVNSQELTNLERLDVSGNKICINGLLYLLDHFFPTRKGEFSYNWLGNVLDKGGKQAGLLVTQSTMQNPELKLNDGEKLSGGSSVQVDVNGRPSFCFRCTLGPGGGDDSGEPRGGNQSPQNAVMHAQEGVADDMSMMDGKCLFPVTRRLSELEVKLKRSGEGFVQLSLEDGDVSQNDTERVRQMVMRKLQSAHTTGGRWMVESVSNAISLKGINASEQMVAVKMYISPRPDPSVLVSSKTAAVQKQTYGAILGILASQLLSGIKGLLPGLMPDGW
jgi:hypothetical protein